MKTICICGGGALGHVIAGMLSNRGFVVNVLTNKPTLWNTSVKVNTIDNKVIEGCLALVSSEPSDVIPQSDIVLLCLPGFLIYDELLKVEKHLTHGALVGSVVSSTGFFIMAKSVLKERFGLFGFQRVPYIARVNTYGESAFLLGYKKSLKVALLHVLSPNDFLIDLEKMFETPVTLLKHVLECTLTNSNPILHPARLYALFSKWDPSISYKKEIFFYEDWDIESSEILIGCDNEFQMIISKLPVDISEMPPLLEYYDSYDSLSLTRKLASIEAFKGIRVPMILTADGYIPDFANRYFTEDIPYGLVLLKYIASIVKIPTPYIDNIIDWSQRVMNLDLLREEKLIGKDVSSITCLKENVIKTFLV